MRLRHSIGAAALVLAAGGCTPLHWVKADTAPERIERDAMDCQQAAWREARLRAWNLRPIAPLPYRDALGRRYLAWPYGPFGDAYYDPYLEEGRLADFCMRTKGYRLEEIPKAKAPAETIQVGSPGTELEFAL